MLNKINKFDLRILIKANFKKETKIMKSIFYMTVRIKFHFS